MNARQRRKFTRAMSRKAEAMKLHNVLQENGVVGSRTGKEPNVRVTAKDRAYTKELYTLSQAALARDGVKEVTLFRGRDAPKALPAGQKVRASSREASSWTDKKQIASNFAERADNGIIIRTTVPAKNILAWHGLFKNAFSENEFVVMGLQAEVSTIVQSFGSPF